MTRANSNSLPTSIHSSNTTPNNDEDTNERELDKSPPLLFQEKPIYSVNDLFPQRGWTRSVVGYLSEAKRLAICINRNRTLINRPYTWIVHLNHNDVLQPNEIKDIWNRAKRKLKKQNIDCLWVREFNRLNKMHYHIVVKNQISQNNLKAVFEKSMPDRSEYRWRKRVERIGNQWILPHYILKAKRSGYDNRGNFHEDLYRAKRLLFLPNLGLRKVGTIGKFWATGMSKKKIWDDIKSTEQKISDGLKQPGMSQLADHIHHMFGKCCSLRQLQRDIGLQSSEPALFEWAVAIMNHSTTGKAGE